MGFCKTLIQSPGIPLLGNRPFQPSPPLSIRPPRFLCKPHIAPASILLNPEAYRGVRCIGSSGHELGESKTEIFVGGDFDSEEEEAAVTAAEGAAELAEQGLWKQVEEIVKFAGPATGLWLCGR
ncbi:hypothetical protein SAY86_001618 [Trapa natans]|uniref:Uncharacterized protein n=1 Tax=Trapa natans TaxID=22666 RepID=A0AAN7LHT7_TRANT|nr:hypothetical protein SAY86_001618 [Trapa natans]